MGFDDDFEQGSLLRRMTSPLRRLLRWIASFGGSGESFGRSASDESALKAIILFPFRIASASIQFLIFNWSTSRNGRSFVLAVPALGVLALLIAELSLAVWRLEANQTIFYQNRYSYYMTNDATFARHCASKLVGLDPSPENKFKLSQAYAKEENLLSAMDVIKPIAPDDQPGYSLAHLWIANRAISDPNWQLTTDERREIAKRHYSHTYELEKDTNTPYGVDAMVRLADFKIMDKDFEGAAATLEGILEKRFETVSHLHAVNRLLAVYKELGREEQVKNAAAVLEPRLYNVATSFPDLVEPWETLVAILAQAERYDQALDYLNDAMALAKNPITMSDLRRVRSNLYLRRAVSIKDTSEREDYSNRFIYLAQSIAVLPNNGDAYRFFSEYVDLNPQHADEEEIIRMAMGSSQVPWVVHTVLGLRDAQRGDFPSAKNHWDIASGQSDQIPTFLGLIMRECLRTKALSHSEVMPILEFCRTKFPGHPVLNLTKTEMLIQDKQFEEAEAIAKDLVKHYGTFVDARVAYAKVLEELGRADEAEAERAKIKEMYLQSQKARQGDRDSNQQ